ncbi:MAG: hypothetical protein IKX09_05965 [Oscillospiraceae bacterium]|nr:hypothetical protein [Oscillospiraceae bacterium]
MAEQENKLKETAEHAVEVAKSAVEGVKEEAKAFAADTKGYSANVVETVKTEGKEVVDEFKAAIKGEKLESSSTEGGAGYRAQGGKPTALEIAAVALGAIAVYLGGILGLVVGVVATALGAKARTENQTTLATAGFVLGAVAVVVNLLGIIF